MADSIARLRYEIDATQAAAASKELERMVMTAARTETAVGRLGGAASLSAREVAALAGSTGAAARQLESVVTGAASAASAGFARMTAQSVASRAALTATFTTVVAGAADFAAMLVPGGILATAVVAGTHKIVDLFVTARDEMKKTQEDFTRRIGAMQQAADADGLTRTAYGVQQQLNPLRARLAQANQNDFGGLTVLEGLNARRTLPAQIQALESQLREIMQRTLAIPEQYTPSSLVFGQTITERVGKSVAAAGATGRARGRVSALSLSNDYSATANFEKTLEALANPLGNIVGGKGGSSLTVAFDGKTAADTLVATARGSAQQVQALAQSLADGMQRTLANAFSGLFTKGLSSAADFARNLRDLVVNAFSEILASRAAAALFGSDGLGKMASGGGLLGALGFAGSKAGNKINNAGGFNFGAASLVGMGGLAAGNLLGQQFGTGAGILGGAASGAALGTIIPGIGNVVGGIIGGLAGAVGGLFGGEARKRAKEAEARAVAEAKAAYAAQQAAEVDSTAGTYGAPTGFSANAYRFAAGRPSATVFSGPITITLPDGSSTDQARRLLRAFSDIAAAEGLPYGMLPRGN